MLDGQQFGRTLHYIKLEGGEWQPGTIYSGVDIVGFSETNDVSAIRACSASGYASPTLRNIQYKKHRKIITFVHRT